MSQPNIFFKKYFIWLIILIIVTLNQENKKKNKRIQKSYTFILQNIVNRNTIIYNIQCTTSLFKSMHLTLNKTCSKRV